MLRTPLLPVDVLTGLDRARLAELCARPDVQEALYVASPLLAEQAARVRSEPDGRRSRKVEHSLLRCVARMAGRATPYGLSAGWSVGTVGPATRLSLAPGARRHTSLDWLVLDALAGSLGEDPDLRRQLAYRPNPSLYGAAGRLRYTEQRSGGTHHLVAVEPSAPLLAALDRAAGGARPDELADAVNAIDPGLDAADFVAQLIETQLLVTDLTPALTGVEPADDLLDQLTALTGPDRPAGVAAPAPSVAASSAAIRLRQAADVLAKLDRVGPGAPIARYADLPTDLGDVHVQLTKPADVVLGRDLAAEILAGVHLLHRIGADQSMDLLTDFVGVFRERYADREVPLCEALDDDLGIGYPVTRGVGAVPAPLLAGLGLPADPEPEPTRSPERDAVLLRLLADTWRAGALEIELGEREQAALSGPGPAKPLPDAFAAVATVLARDPDAVAAGDYRILLSGAGGPSGANLLGRCCRGDERLTGLVRTYLAREEALHPDAVFAEIAHRPPGRVANVLARPLLRGHEIVYLGRSGAPRDRQIQLADLLVRVEGARVVLRSRRLGREVVPRLTTAHHTDTAGALGPYRFLCAVARQGLAGALRFSFGPYAGAPRLPRVTCGRLVLAPARWNLTAEQLTPLASPRRYDAMRGLRRELGLPPRVAVAEGDRVLPVDLDCELFVDGLAGLAAGRSNLALVEVFHGEEDVLAAGPDGRYVHELIVPFVRTLQPRRPPRPRQPAPAAPRAHPPGSDWLYAKLYTGVASADTVLDRLIRPVVREALATGAADRWFFVRYADPDPHLRLRLHGVPQRLLAEVLPQLSDSAVRRLQLDTYEPELERYGGPTGMRLAEQLFHADSDAAVALLPTVAGDAGADDRWQLVLLGLDRLLADLLPDLASRRAVIRSARDRLAGDLRVDATIRRRLGSRHRRDRAAVEAALAGPTPAQYAERSRRLQPLVAELRAAELSRPLPVLAGHYLHLHANRMLRSAVREHELVLYDHLDRLYCSRAARSI